MDRLTPAQFETLLHTLHSDRDLAGSEYEKIRRKLINYFRWNYCVSAEDLADETFNRVAKKIQYERIENLMGFIWGIAKRVLQEAKKREVLRSAGSPEMNSKHAWQAPTQEAVHDQIELEHRLKCFQRCF